MFWKKTILPCILICALFFYFPIPVHADTGNSIDTSTYYYDKLPEEARVWYDRLKEIYDVGSSVNGRKVAYEETLTLTEGVYNQLTNNILAGEAALYADDPTYRYKGRVDSTGFDGNFGTTSQFYITIDFGTFLPDSFIAETEARIDQIVKTIGNGDRYTKLRKLAQYLRDNAFYDPYLDIANDGGSFSLDTRGFHYNTILYGLMLKNVAICEGFSQSVKVLCNELEIPCIIMGNEGHSWNLVQMEDGSWYRLDITNACALGWDGTAPDDYFTNTFLNNNALGTYSDPFMININNIHYVTEFPNLAPGQYQYTGSTTDFSYTEVPSAFSPSAPTFHYRLNEDGATCTVTLYEGPESGDLVIPAQLDNHPVTAIDPYAFYYCSGFTGKLVIPDTVITIGKAAFAGCYGLTSAQLPKSLKEIGAVAFIGCKGLESLELPGLVDTIREFAFYDCDKLQSVTFGSHIQNMERGIFKEIGGKLTIYAPTGSVVETYASQNGLTFQPQGELCSPDTSTKQYEIDENRHYFICQHGARIGYAEHKVEKENPACGDCCAACGAVYCAGENIYGEDILINDNAFPANCAEPAFTGDTFCPCGAYFIPGEYVGTPSSEHVADKQAPWDYDETHHFKSCICAKESVEKEAHTPGRITESGMNVCSICGAEYRSAPTFEQVPDTQMPQQTDKPSVTQHWVILLIASICVTTGVLAVYILIRKKRVPKEAVNHSKTPE